MIKILFPCVFVLLNASVTSAGDKAGNGGNGFVADFYRHASEATWTLAELSGGKEYLKVGPDLVETHALRHLLDGVSVTETDKTLYVKGLKVSAINYPKSKKIIFNSNDWKSFDRRAKLNLIFHELIGVKFNEKLNDGNFAYSKSLTDQLFKFEESKIYYCSNADLTVRRTEYYYTIKSGDKVERISDDGKYLVSLENIDGIVWIGVINKIQNQNTKYALYASTTGGEVSLGEPPMAFECRRAGTKN